MADRIRAARGTASLPAAGATPDWTAPVKLNRLGRAGLINRFVFRAPASSTATGIEVMVWVGDENEEVADPDTEVLAENRIMHRTGISVTGAAVTPADDDHVFNPKPAYDVEEYARFARYEDRRAEHVLWISFKTTAGTAQEDCQWALYAEQVS